MQKQIQLQNQSVGGTSAVPLSGSMSGVTSVLGTSSLAGGSAIRRGGSATSVNVASAKSQSQVQASEQARAKSKAMTAEQREEANRFYIGCDLCSNWFHGSCVGISEDEAKYIDSYICEDCRKQQENTSEELYCLCRTPYDENQFYIGCDRCQDWFHGRCVGISESEADKLDVYLCPNCQKQEKADPIAQKPLTVPEYQQLAKLLKDIQSHKMAWPFLQPVDPTEVPDYYDIVSEPMDLTIVEAKLNAKAYTKLNDFMKDMTKIFDNCRLYNPVDTPYFQCAEVVETYFAQRVKSLRSSNKLQELAANKPMSKEEMVDGQVEIMCELFMGCVSQRTMARRRESHVARETWEEGRNSCSQNDMGGAEELSCSQRGMGRGEKLM
ncbi:hypothetical protein RRG08_036999 [Elysia crispata]|uniref:Uncharacterized protein n=1 Tax=Elysia crispata TaxID=231223 RepID=A0AAE0XUX6_9GAST|nr:hypothetical protein RRG08_036999 [Elysia crispata]